MTFACVQRVDFKAYSRLHRSKSIIIKERNGCY